MNVTGAGIFNRGLDDNPSAIWDDVASEKTKYTLFPVRKSVYGCIE